MNTCVVVTENADMPVQVQGVDTITGTPLRCKVWLMLSVAIVKQ